MSHARRRRWAVVLLCVGAAVVALRLFVVTSVRVAGESMAPTLHQGQVLLVDKLGDDVHRGDLVVFHDPNQGTPSVKRVVGVAGDRVVIRDAVLSVNNREVPEPYVDRASIDGLYTPTTVVPEGHVFVLGDNRARSLDSRVYGPVALDDVDGRVLLRLWPPGLP
jgi:signal peptidase I